MKRYIFIFFMILSLSYGGEVGIYRPVVKNLPGEYSSVFLSFFLNNFSNVEMYSKKSSYRYTVKPIFSSIGGNYNICLDIYRNNNLTKVLCSSAESGKQLFEKLIYLTKKTGIFRSKKQFRRKQIYLKLLTNSRQFEKKMKVVSHNGDILINYIEAKKFKGQQFPHITAGNGIINIDTVILDSAEASKVLEYLLKGYSFIGILIITVK
ncbi:hypothetical protein GWK41_07970 [Persephonella atlantica]|uniref:Uncharacterized protein n=1 Tax=Persephonella atlantica TaxID=2699429 RepID=A0ABS1GJ95_9AQUI|nr:hypothetical protein [Persephonella atlantica]MBK3333003.1 hypothetical protein [Persephonella atlantica]